MNPVLLPATDLAVSPLCLGGLHFGTSTGENKSFALLDRFVAAGGNFIDTARIYSDWVPGETRRSERIIGDWLKARRARARVVLSTKGAHAFIGSLQTPRSSAAEIRDDLEGSLRQLRTDVIDLYWLHRDDDRRPVEHYVDLLNVFHRQGKIRYLGASNWSPARIAAANAYARRTGQLGFAANQPGWSLGCQAARPPKDPNLVRFDASAYRFHLRSGLAVIPYTAQARGFFSKLALPRARQPAKLRQDDYFVPTNVATAKVVWRIARDRGVKPSTIVLAYVWSRPFPVIPIIGCRTFAQLQECVDAVPVRLTAGELRALEEVSKSGLPMKT